MELTVKRFNELTVPELYAILRARCDVFVVEQKCAYVDIDGVDPRALHMYIRKNGAVIAYLRVFEKEDEPGTLQIGRVLTVRRGEGLGKFLLREALGYILSELRPKRLFLEAQCYATGFYEREGFRICGEPFDEDGIPHVAMELIP